MSISRRLGIELRTVHVYGSCVSRDLAALFASKLECTDYIARQGWISAASKGIAAVRDSQLTSPFQQRMLDGDLTSSALPALEGALADSDLVLLDLIDDRFGVYPVSGGYITPSAEFGASGVRSSLPLESHVPFGTDQHFDLWRQSANRVRQSIGEYNWKTFLLEAPFTESSVDGSQIEPALEKSAQTWNQLYERYYLHARQLGIQVVTLPDAFAVSTPYHKWGSAPFHYVEAAYGWWFDRIQESLEVNLAA
jgi:hypothetical protein